ncbi:MAG: TRAP transporter small permease [Desulfuromusa sp.]|nr:TRAP transporter small permease [Desulfuromusa sp.]
MGKLLDRICFFAAWIACLLLLFDAFSIGYSIITRHLGLSTPVWVIQFVEYSLLWITFLGTAWVLSNNKHVALPLITDRLGEKGRRNIAVVHNFVGMGLCGVLCWFGSMTTWDHFVRQITDVGSVDVSKALVIVVIPIGFLLLTLQFMRKFYVGTAAIIRAKTQHTLASSQNEEDF